MSPSRRAVLTALVFVGGALVLGVLIDLAFFGALRAVMPVVLP